MRAHTHKIDAARCRQAGNTDAARSEIVKILIQVKEKFTANCRPIARSEMDAIK